MTATHHKSLPMSGYQAARDHLSKSMLSKLADCPAVFKYHYIDGGEQDETPSLRIGSAAHTLALEPELWKSGYYKMPQKDDGKEIVRNPAHAAYKEQISIAGDRIILTTKEYESIESMANAILKSPLAVGLLKAHGYVESSIFWTDAAGRKKRCRPDFCRNDALIVDLKMTKSVKPAFFFKDARNFHYDLSVALTCEGYEALFNKPPEEYVFLCIEPEPPYLIEAFSTFEEADMGVSYLSYGRGRLMELLAKYDECTASGVWPSYVGKITPMRLPAWARNVSGEE